MLGATAAMWALIEADLAERGVAVDRSSHQCALLTGARQGLGLADKVIVKGQCRPHAYLKASQSSSFDDGIRAVLVAEADRDMRQTQGFWKAAKCSAGRWCPEVIGAQHCRLPAVRGWS